MKTAPRWIVVFPPAEQVPQYIVDCRLVVKGMTDNPHFPSPTPPLAEVTAHLAALEACEHDAQRGGEDATAQRNAALALVERDMRLLKAHVQNVADGHPHAEAQAIITSAGMGVKKKVVRAKPPVAAKHGNIPGRVVLRAKALPAPVQYRWQWSTDQASWIDLPETFRAECTLDGLTPATIVYFRLRTMTRHGLGEWSQTVSIIVH